jgi:hypothetical protein
VRKRVEYIQNIVFYHRAKREHPEREKNIKIPNKTIHGGKQSIELK